MAIQNSLSVAQVQARSAVAYRSYTVKAGDTLYGIARTHLGDEDRWREIYNLNKTTIGSNPHLIYPGQVFRLPPRSATPAPRPTPKPNPTPRPNPRPNPVPGDTLDLPGAVRIGSPLLVKVGTWIADKLGLGGGFGGGGVGGGFFKPGSGGGILPGDIGGGAIPGDIGGGGFDPGSGGLIGDEGLSGGFSGGGGGVGGAVGNAFQSVKNALGTGFQAAVSGLKRNFLFAGITSAVTNGLAFATGKATGKQAVSGFVADTGAYTVIGSASTFAGAAIGTLIPIPFVGTAIGIAAGMGLGYLYEKMFRPRLTSTVQQAIFR